MMALDSLKARMTSDPLHCFRHALKHPADEECPGCKAQRLERLVTAAPRGRETGGGSYRGWDPARFY